MMRIIPLLGHAVRTMHGCGRSERCPGAVPVLTSFNSTWSCSQLLIRGHENMHVDQVSACVEDSWQAKAHTDSQSAMR
eukprot:6203933-Amphidinium_carterae.1